LGAAYSTFTGVESYSLPTRSVGDLFMDLAASTQPDGRQWAATAKRPARRSRPGGDV